MRSPKLVFACTLLALLSCAGVASAEPARAARNQNVVFDDDLLNADLSTPFGDPLFAGHLRPTRVLLIRPRTSFVPELYKSVEHI